MPQGKGQIRDAGQGGGKRPGHQAVLPSTEFSVFFSVKTYDLGAPKLVQDSVLCA